MPGKSWRSWASIAIAAFVVTGCTSPVDGGGQHGQTPASGESTRNGPNGEWVHFVSPTHEAVVSNPVTFKVAAGGVATVAVDAEGWHLSSPWDPSQNDTFTYTFVGTGCPRYMGLTGFDQHGQVVAEHKITITVADTGTNAKVSIDAPSDGAVVHNPVTFHISAPGVDLVKIAADGWMMHEWSPQTTTEFTYEFNYTEAPRNVVLTGYDTYGHELGTDEITISFEDSGSDDPGGGSNPSGGGGGNPLDVPYFHQYDNAYEPGATCGLTSAAMLINYFYPGSESPDHLYTTYGKAQGQSPGNLENLYRWEGLYANSTYGGTRQMLKDNIDAGRPVVVHTFLTGAGHVIVITGYDGSGWWVNDPAGDWYQCYGCGISGEQVHYPFGSSSDEALSYDGDIWFSAGDLQNFSL